MLPERGVLAALCALAAIGGAPVALAQEPAAPPAPVPRTGLSAADILDFAANAQAAGDRNAAISAYRALANDPDVAVRSEARFRHAQLLAAQGDLAGAGVLLRAILDEQPQAARVRIELARILALLGDGDGARRELRQAQATGLPPDVALVVNQFANALRARKPFGGSLSFALVPDSNINRATDRETLDTIIAPLELSDDARETSGIGVRIGGQAYARLPLAADLTLLPRVSGQAELYRQRQFNDISLSAAAALEWSPGRRDRLSPTIAHTARFFGGTLYAETQSAAVTWARSLGATRQVAVTGTAARADYKINDLQDGWLFDLSATAEQALSARSGIGLTVTASRQTARDPGYQTMSGGASIVYGREMGRISAFATAGLRWLEADERLFLFPDRRREWMLSGGIGATFRQLTVAGFAPSIRVSAERNFSTVGIYDYSRVAVDFGITRAF